MIGTWRFAIAVCLLMAAGLALRLWNIDFAIPSFYHPDEEKKVSIIGRYLEHRDQDFAMHPVEHPGLMIGMAANAVRIAGLFGVPRTPTNILIVGRIAAAVCLTAMIALTALLGAALYNRRAGVLAGAIAAFSPELVIHSRYLKEDAFMMVFIVAGVLGAVWWIQCESGPRRIWALLFCAAGCGFAAAGKWVGFFVLAVVLIDALFIRRVPAREWIVFLFVAFAVFLLGATMLVTHPGQLWNDFGFAMFRGAKPEGGDSPMTIFSRHDLGTFFLFHGINWGLGWPLAIVAIWAVVRAILSRRMQPAARLVALVALVWYFTADMTTLKRAPDVERYVIPCLPFLAALAAGLIMNLRWRYWPAVAYVLVLILAIHSAAITHSLKPDTRELAAKWLFELCNGKPGRIAFVNGPSIYTPDINLLPGATAINLPLVMQNLHYDIVPVSNADVLAISDYTTGRYENYPRMNPQPVRDLKKLRDEFPYAKIFRKPWYAHIGFHNPVIEIRFRTPIMESAEP